MIFWFINAVLEAGVFMRRKNQHLFLILFVLKDFPSRRVLPLKLNDFRKKAIFVSVGFFFCENLTESRPLNMHL